MTATMPTSNAFDRTDTDDGMIEFVEPVPGFPDRRRFELSTIDEAGLFYFLRADDVRFVVVPPAVIRADYAPQLPSWVGDRVGPDPLLLLVLTISTNLADATANLRAPIAVCPVTRRAAQVVLEDDGLSFREPVDLAPAA